MPPGPISPHNKPSQSVGRRSAKDAVEIPQVPPTGWHRSMPGDARKNPVRPSDVFPVFRLPENWRDYCRAGAMAHLPPGDEPDKMELVKELAWTGAEWRYAGQPARNLLGKCEAGTPAGPIPEKVRERLLHEIGIVELVGYADYFLIVWDICREAAQRRIPFLARGSAADSLLCYVLGISTVCPLRFNLYFERFLNPERMKFSKLADIDLDFPWDQRDEMMDYVFTRWGHEHVAMLGGFNRFHGRAAVADIGKVHGLSEREVRYFTARLPHVSAARIAEALEESVLRREMPADEEPYPEIIELARHFEGLPRHYMMHPCGIVISREPLKRLIPLMPSGRGPQMTQCDMDTAEDMGLVKIDLLGQAGLSVLRDVLQALEKYCGVRVDLERIPWEDELTWEMIATGGARGVHHIESPAMTSLLVQANCRDMDCLCAIVSVIRPGAADESKKLGFTRRHQGLEPARFPHECLREHLADTYGLLVYEEHILMVAHHFAGMNLGRSDVLRRELVKMKNPEKLIELGLEFRECARELGRTEDEIKEVWRTLVAFHGYMFNKAHSASYAVEAYQGAYLKARWPAVYMAAVLGNERGFYSPLFYAMECRRLGVGLVLPDVNCPNPSFQAEHRNGQWVVRPPVSCIKGLSRKTAARWRQEIVRGKFADAADFFFRVLPNEADIPLLVQTGAVDFAAEGEEMEARLQRRPGTFWQLKQLAADVPASVDTDDLFLRETAGDMRGARFIPDGLEPTTLHDAAAREFALLGFPVSLDVFSLLGPKVARETYCPVAHASRFHGKSVWMCGMVVQRRSNHTLKGDVMQFFTLADESGLIECTVFPKVNRVCGHLARTGNLIGVQATVDPFDNAHGQTLNVRSITFPRVRRENKVS